MGLNLSLDKWTLSRYCSVKVLLTVSPFRPSFLQPPALHSENDRFSTPFISSASESLFSQLLCFHIYLRCPLVFCVSLNFQVSRPFQRVKRCLAITIFRMNTCKSVSKQRTLTPFRMNTYAKPQGDAPAVRNRVAAYLTRARHHFMLWRRIQEHACSFATLSFGFLPSAALPTLLRAAA